MADAFNNSNTTPAAPSGRSAAARESGEPKAEGRRRPASGQPQTRRSRMLRPLTRIACLLLAGVFFLLGVLGAILPGLPTTPFLLLTSYFLVRSWPRLNSLLLRSGFFGQILNDWQVHGGVRKEVKGRAILVVVTVVTLTVLLSSAILPVRLGIIALAGIGIVVLAKLPETP